jgi:biotin transport system substrate-specific component
MQSAIPSELGIKQRTGSFQNSMTGKTLLVIGASAVVAACAHISLPLPFTPVPLILSNFAVLLVGLALGPAPAFSALVLYLAEGAMGLPVFAPNTPGGIAHLVGPTGGYLFAYPIAAAVAGWVVRALQPVTTRFRSALVASIAATLLIFILGAAWLAHFAHLTAAAAWTLAVAPFIPGEIVKITAAAGIYSTFQRWKRS